MISARAKLPPLAGHGLFTGRRSQVDAHVGHEELHVFPHVFLGGGIAQQVRGVVGAEDFEVSHFVEFSSESSHRDAGGNSQHVRRGDEAPADDVLRLDDPQLSLEILAAIAALRGLGRAIVGWAALENVADVEILAFQFRRGDDLVQQLPRLAHERFALRVLVGSRGFADEHNRRHDIPHAKHRARAVPHQHFATLALRHRLVQHRELRGTLIPRERWPLRNGRFGNRIVRDDAATGARRLRGGNGGGTVCRGLLRQRCGLRLAKQRSRSRCGRRWLCGNWRASRGG